MMSKSSEYWGTRLDEVAQRRFDLTQNELDNQFKKMYNSASKRIKKQVEELYYKLLEEGLLSTTELYSYKRYIELQDSINKELYKLGVEEIKLINPALSYAFEEAFEKTIKEMGKKAISFVLINPIMVEQLVHQNWSGEHFSNRIWTNKDKLRLLLEDGIERCIINGESKDKLVEEIKNAFGKSFNDADRIVRSELMHIINEGQRQSYKANGYKELEILVTLDERICKKCGPKDGKKIPIDSTEIPIFHPRCRCTTMPVIDGDKEGQTRIAKDPLTGEKYYISANMTYEEWYEQMVIGKHGKEKVDLHMKKLRNTTSDKKQHERYRDLLGKDIPKSFDKFKDLKYTNDKKWKFSKLDYSRRKALKEKPNLILPNADNVHIANEKFTKYLLGGENQAGLAKGKAFESRLGYTSSNWKELKKEIEIRATKYPVISKGNNGFGERYEQKIIIYGKKDTPANVVVGWIDKLDGTTSMSSAYIKEA